MTTPLNMFEMTSEELARQDLVEENEHGSHEIIRLWTERFGISHEDTTTIVRFSEDIVQTLFVFVDTAATVLCLRHGAAMGPLFVLSSIESGVRRSIRCGTCRIRFVVRLRPSLMG